MLILTWVRFIGTIALNASMFAAVVLGSRLQSNEHAFGFILFAIEVFAMLPLVHYNLQVCLMGFCFL